MRCCKGRSRKLYRTSMFGKTYDRWTVCLFTLSRWFVDSADMRRHYTPAFWKSYPRLHLPPDFARLVGAVGQERGDGKISTVGCDHGLDMNPRGHQGLSGFSEGL